MARLIEWFPGIIDPGASSLSDPENRTEIYVHKAVFDEPVDFDFIYNQPQCPIYFQVLPTNRFLFVVGREVKQIPEAPQCYEIRITYSNKWTNSQNSDKPNVNFTFIEDPVLRPALITGSKYTLREGVEFAERMVVNIKDNGQVTVNSAESKALVGTSVGEPLVLEEEYHHRLFTLTKNVRTLTDLMIKGGDFINEDVVQFNGSTVKFQKGTLWLWPIEFGHVSVENGFYYFPITMTILHNPKTWIRRVRNAGYFMGSPNISFRKDNNGAWVPYRPMIPIRYSNGSKPDRPVLLRPRIIGNASVTVPLQYVETGLVPAPDGLDQNGNVPPAGQGPRLNRTFDIQSPEDFGRAFTEDELKQTTRYFRTFDWLKFQGNVPLT